MNAYTATVKLWVVLALVAGLAFAASAQPAATPLLQLQPITVANGTAVVTGSLASQGGATSVSVNGRPADVDSSGNFSAVVPLNGAASIAIGLQEAGSPPSTAVQISLTGALLGA